MQKCGICQSIADVVGRKRGQLDNREFVLYQCPRCHYSFVGNPLLDFNKIYSEAYYRGYGVDSLVDYVYELEHPENTVRTYEWKGIVNIVKSLYLRPLNSDVHWLDYGCGNGGLVRYIRSTTACDAMGFDEGWVVDKATEMGIPIIRKKDLLATPARYDIVTAIEVLEHVETPLTVLQQIRNVLKPGGLFFYTTGNARVHRKDLINWAYFIPEIHISLYEPETLSLALKKTGFRSQILDKWYPAWIDIIRFKVLKNLHIRRPNAFEKAIPWELVGWLVNTVMKIDAHPIGWAGD